MNKLFPLHNNTRKRVDNRLYYTGRWEPIKVESFRLPPFQYKVTASDYWTASDYFKVEEVRNGVTTNITSKFTGLVTYYNGYVSYSGAMLRDFIPPGPVRFIMHTGERFYSEDCEVCDTQNWVTRISSSAGSPSLGYFDRWNSFRLNNVSDYVVTNTFSIEKGETIGVFVNHNPLEPITKIYRLTDGTNTVNLTTLTSAGSDYYLTGVSTFSSESAYIRFGYYAAPGTTHQIRMFYVVKDYSNTHLKLNISSSLDYAQTYYRGGWSQWAWKLANVTRSPEPRITIIGDERNGVIVQEKVTTATRYRMRLKVSEYELAALTTMIGATCTVQDQYGRTYTMQNIEVDTPEWYRTNGIVTVSFDEDINTYTQTNDNA